MIDGAAPLPAVALLGKVVGVGARYRYKGAWSDRWDGTQGAPLPQAAELTIRRTDGSALRLMLLVGSGYAPAQPGAQPGPQPSPTERPVPSERERGAALLTVLLLVAIIAVLAGAALERLRLTTRLAGNALAGEQARGFARAAEALATSRITTMLGDAPDRVTLAGGWSGRPFGLPLPGGGLAVARVRDGGNCFNLNGLVSRLAPNLYTSSQNFAQRLQFVRLMQAIGVPSQAADHIAAATADWIDSDGDQQGNGAEDPVYLARSVPYRTAGTLMADPASCARWMA